MDHGICVSGKIHDEVCNKVACQFEDMGEQKLKNISTPVRAFRIFSKRPLNANGFKPADQRRLGDRIRITAQLLGMTVEVKVAKETTPTKISAV